MSDKEIKAAERELADTATRLGAMQARRGDAAPWNYFTDLVGEPAYLGGHRFSIVATIESVEITGRGEAVAILVDAYQIDDDTDDCITGAFRLGDGFRFPESCVGYGVQPLSGASSGYRASYEELKRAKPGK